MSSRGGRGRATFPSLAGRGRGRGGGRSLTGGRNNGRGRSNYGARGSGSGTISGAFTFDNIVNDMLKPFLTFSNLNHVNYYVQVEDPIIIMHVALRVPP